METVSLVMTVLGRDRPGVVESLAEVIANHGGNWVESRMAHLAGQFAGILRVEIDANRADELTKSLRELEKLDLDLIVHSDDAPPSSTESGQGLVRLELVGQDRPGIVSEITHVLAAHGVNVEDLTTECIAAPNTGQRIFKASAALQLSPNASESKLRQELEEIATDMMVDITIQ